MAPGRRHKLHHSKSPKVDAVRNEINVTPLVDVCLVLLIIFMVILPMLERGKDVRVPKTDHHVDAKDNNQPIVALAKDQEGWKLYVDKREVGAGKAFDAKLPDVVQAVKDEWDALSARNTRTNAVDRSGESRVLIKVQADANFGEAKYSQVYPLIIALHEGGASGIDLGTTDAKVGKSE
jgi:biopolymer transport protein ExbD